MSTPTEAHRKLSEEISHIHATFHHEKAVAAVLKLLADSEARAVEADRLARMADNELGDWQAECRKERERVRVLEGVLKAALDPLQELADDEQTFWGVGNPIAQQSQKIYEDAKAALAANDAKEGSK